MLERNPCKEMGCPAACCKNIAGHVKGRVDFFKRAFPGAIALESVDAVRQKIAHQEHGVYYFEERGRIDFAVSGNCPNLSADNSCNIHGQRFYPMFCFDMIVKSMECSDAQIKNQLNELSSMPLPDK
jgi:hypothetical protein